MTSPPEPLVEEATVCIYCGGPAGPEQDGEAVYFACPDCGGTFGYRRLSQGSFCAAGLPLPAPEPVFVAVTIAMRRPE